MLLGLTLVLSAPAVAKTQYAFQKNSINDLSNVNQKLLRYFNNATIFVFFKI